MDSQVTTLTSKLFNTEELHIEVSSKCTLKCPRCPRTEFKPEQLNREITLQEFKRAFNISVLVGVKRIVFCGDIGDPIYATELTEIVEYLKTNKIQITIVTNGSYKSKFWWEHLGSLLDKNDLVTFSVDGYDNASNNLYRVNSDWDSIVGGVKALRTVSDCRIRWSTIVFNFNEDRIEEIKKFAERIGCNEFQEVNSTKFDGRYLVNGVDPLKPSFTISGNMYDKNTTPLGQHRIPIIMQNVVDRHSWAKCLNWKKELFINVDGLVFPCPWFNSGYQENDFVQKYQDRLSVKTRSLTEVLADPMWEEFITRLAVFPLEVCKLKCKYDR